MRGSQPWWTNRARVLRAQPTSAEERMWGKLRARRLGGFKFVRQAPIDRYVVDFVCRACRIVVEIDGGTHGSSADIARDGERTACLEALGYRVVRVHNLDVYESIDRVLSALLALCQDSAR